MCPAERKAAQRKGGEEASSSSSSEAKPEGEAAAAAAANGQAEATSEAAAGGIPTTVVSHTQVRNTMQGGGGCLKSEPTLSAVWSGSISRRRSLHQRVETVHPPPFPACALVAHPGICLGMYIGHAYAMQGTFHLARVSPAQDLCMACMLNACVLNLYPPHR